MEALLLGDSPQEEETAECTAAAQAGVRDRGEGTTLTPLDAEEQGLEEGEGAAAMQQLGTTGSCQTQGEEAD
eukprot:12505937-Ditylum_brightwellii.AAC.2